MSYYISYYIYNIYNHTMPSFITYTRPYLFIPSLLGEHVSCLWFLMLESVLKWALLCTYVGFLWV